MESKDKVLSDLGSLLTRPKTTHSDIQTVTVVINPQTMVLDYAKAITIELHRCNPLLWEDYPVSEEAMYEYAVFLLQQRIDCVHNRCKNWSRLKACYIPEFLQYVLTTVGKVADHDYGILVIPEMDEAPKPVDIQSGAPKSKPDYTIDDALEFSQYLSWYSRDIGMRKDAMPRGDQGDESVMNMAVVANYVCGRLTSQEALQSYVAGFLDLKLRQEQTFGILYRIRYDDIALMREELMSAHYLVGRASRVAQT